MLLCGTDIFFRQGKYQILGHLHKKNIGMGDQGIDKLQNQDLTNILKISGENCSQNPKDSNSGAL